MSEGDDFDLRAAMAAMGVKRIDKGSGGSRQRPGIKKQTRVVTNVQPSPPASEKEGPNLLDQALKRHKALELELQKTASILRDEREQADQLRLENEALKSAILEPSPNVYEHSEVEDSLSSMFRERGLRGRGEYGALVLELLENQRLFDILT